MGSESGSVRDLVVEGIEKLLCSRGEALGLPISPAWRFEARLGQETAWVRKLVHGAGLCSMKGTISRCIQGNAHDVCSDGHRVYAARRHSGDIVVTNYRVRCINRSVRSWQQVPPRSRIMICARGKNLLTSQRLQLQPAGEAALRRWLLASTEDALERRSVLGSGIQRGNKATTLHTHVIAYINPRHIFTSSSNRTTELSRTSNNHNSTQSTMSAPIARAASQVGKAAAGKASEGHVLQKGAKRDPELYVCNAAFLKGPVD